MRDAVTRAIECNRASLDHYSKAEQALETALDLATIDSAIMTEAAKWELVNLSQLAANHRIDAQCFTPKAMRYEQWLESHAQCDRLSNLLEGALKGQQHVESAQGTSAYCSIKHIDRGEIVSVARCRPSPRAAFAMRDDLLLAITGATIGKVGVVTRDSPTVFSGDLLCLRTNESIDPYYLLVTLAHRIGQIQCARWISGSTNGHLAPRDVRKLLVPRVGTRSEQTISTLVRESFRCRLESEGLLHSAIAQVEQAIEEAIKQ